MRPDPQAPPGKAAAGLPAAVRPLVAFAPLLRANGFAVAPDQSERFVAAVGLLGPRSMADIHAAARATLAPPPERFDAFDALFRAHFLGQTLAAAPSAQDEDDTAALEPLDDGEEPVTPEEASEAGTEAAAAEVLAVRRLAPLPNRVLAGFAQAAERALPRQRARRLRRARRGRIVDTRRLMREAAGRDGEVLRLPRRARRSRQRRILLLVDVSGSMKGMTDDAMRFAHTLARTAERAEVFTIGTRLTRVTRALRHRQAETALAAASAAVADWDGGTRLGDTLDAFLAVPRFKGFARSATVFVISDGLERDDPTALADAVTRLSRIAHAIVWLTPLADGPAFVPQTEALAQIAPLARFGSAADLTRLTRDALALGAAPRQVR